MEFLVFILGIAAVLQAILFSVRIRRLQSKIDELQGQVRHSAPILQNLIQRVFVLEGGGRPGVPEPLLPENARVEAVAAEEHPRVIAPRPSRDFEAMIGGNLLNKLGALILVIGIALFLGYSLTQLGPAGKVLIGLAVGVSLLAAGVLTEKKENYVAFGRGLIGAGWATIYFTTYAVHGIEAARLVESPIAGTALLLAVSVMMIAHSFVYRSEPVTVLAYFIAFVTLNISPLTQFAIIAAVVLSVSVILLAERYRWAQLAMAGIMLTYVTFLLRYDPGIYSMQGVWNGQIVLWIYWITFEAFGLIAVKNRWSGTRLLLPLNAIGFVTASVFHQEQMHSAELAKLLTLLAGAYLVSTLVRGRLSPASEGAPLQRFFNGAWEPALFIAMAVGAGACIERFEGLHLAVALLIEAELLVAAGLLLRDRYITSVAPWFAALPFLHLIAVDLGNTRTIALGGRTFHVWTPFALLLASSFVANRILTGGILYVSAAAACLAIVTHEEFSPSWATVAWMILAAIGLAAGTYWNDRQTRRQTYAFAVLVVLRTITINFRWEQEASRLSTVGIVVAILYGSQLLLHALRLDGYARIGYCVSATLLLTMLIVRDAPGREMTLLLGVEGISLLSAGFLLRERALRMAGLAVFLGCIAKLFIHDLSQLDTVSRILSFIVLGVMLLGASWAYTRYKDQIHRLL